MRVKRVKLRTILKYLGKVDYLYPRQYRNYKATNEKTGIGFEIGLYHNKRGLFLNRYVSLFNENNSEVIQIDGWFKETIICLYILIKFRSNIKENTKDFIEKENEYFNRTIKKIIGEK